MTFPAVMIGSFIIIGVAILARGLYGLFSKGGWYIGMPEGLSHYRKGKTAFRKWNEFKSDVETSGNDQKGDVTLNFQSRGSLLIAGIPNATGIAEICKQRIKGKEPSTK